ncbi:MAG: S41 family peptidase [Phenylobacterium sp.]
MKKHLLIGVSAFILGAGATAYLNQSAVAAAASGAESYRVLELFGDVVQAVEENYVTEVEPRKLIEAALDGMLTSLDPHSDYLTPEALNDMRDQTRGEYGGLGLEISSEEGVVKVISPMDGTPAYKAGVKPGDYITAVNGQSVIGMSVSEAVKLMRGPPGEAVTLSIAREKTDPFDVRIVREVIKTRSAVARMEGEYGYLRVSAFNEKTTEEARTAFEDLKAKNSGMKGLILDLRNNPGGLVDQAVGISDLFLENGEIVSQRGRNPRDIERYNARAGDITGGMRMVVLINTGSASASEIVAGALQDRKRAELVGLTSFGKGSVQTLIPLRGGADGAIKLTTARYYTPSGRSIQKTGIAPDLEVAQSREEAQALANRAFQFSEAALRNALTADEGKARAAPHEPAEAPPADFNPRTGDFQLSRAKDVLRYGSVAATPKLPKPVARMAEVVGSRNPAPGTAKGPETAAHPPAPKP